MATIRKLRLAKNEAFDKLLNSFACEQFDLFLNYIKAEYEWNRSIDAVSFR